MMIVAETGRRRPFERTTLRGSHGASSECIGRENLFDPRVLAELDDNDVTNNRVHYYLPDAQGGHVGMLLDDDGDLCGTGMLPVQSRRAGCGMRSRVVGSLGGAVDVSTQVQNLCHTQTYDAFGNAMSKTFTAAGSFAWRGAEGSVTDRETDRDGSPEGTTPPTRVGATFAHIVSELSGR